jgi:hypothetical protein
LLIIYAFTPWRDDVSQIVEDILGLRALMLIQKLDQIVSEIAGTLKPDFRFSRVIAIGLAEPCRAIDRDCIEQTARHHHFAAIKVLRESQARAKQA